jgi:hydrogenase nickel incorporation protein HypA/HybF
MKAARESAAASGLGSVSEVVVVLGELQAIDREIFSFALEGLAKDSAAGFPQCRFRLLKEPAGFKCRACSREFGLKALKKTPQEGEYIHFIPEMAHTFLKCPACKSPDFDVTAGRGVYIKHIRGRK